VKLSFNGADRGVTGSCHMIEAAGKRILIDCGLYQGGKELDEENEEPFGFDAAAIDLVLLTHAHLDHCGRLPLLVKRGFKGEIISTSATAELARLVMVDAANLQGFRQGVKIAFGGGVTSEMLEEVVGGGADIIDIGRAIIDAPILDFRLDVSKRFERRHTD